MFVNLPNVHTHTKKRDSKQMNAPNYTNEDIIEAVTSIGRDTSYQAHGMVIEQYKVMIYCDYDENKKMKFNPFCEQVLRIVAKKYVIKAIPSPSIYASMEDTCYYKLIPKWIARQLNSLD